MDTRRWTGRWPAVVVVVALTLGLVMLMARPVVGQEPGHGHGPTGAEGILPPEGWPEGQTGWTQEQIDYAVGKVAEAEAVMPAKFGDQQKAIDLGYRMFTIVINGYEHWGLPPTTPPREHAFLDFDMPDTLVYQRMPDGTKRLVAGMFFAPPGTTMATIPPDIAWLPGWHTHENEVCVDENGQSTGSFPSGGKCAVGKPLVTPMTHIWIVENHCDHRFAGIDGGGVNCYARHGHEFPPGTFPGTVPPRPVTTTTTKPGSQTAPPATPVKATPLYTG